MKKILPRWLRQLIYFFLLGCIWLGVCLYQIFFTDFSFTVLSHNYSQHIFKNYTEHKITSGTKITGSFVAASDHLALVGIRFHTTSNDNAGFLSFRLKEKAAKEWRTQQKIRTTFTDNEIYNFGFEPIPDSANKTFIFELYSDTSTINNAVNLSHTEPVVIARYKYPRNTLTSNREELLSFLYKKAIYGLQEPEMQRVLLGYFLLLLIYIVIKRSYLLVFISLILVILVDVFVATRIHNPFIFLTALTALYLCNSDQCIRRYYLLGFLLLFFASVSYVLKFEMVSLKTTYWAFLLFLIGNLSAIRLLRYNE